MPCKFPSGHPDENNNFGNAEVCGRYGGVWVDLPGSQASNEQLDFLTNFTGSGVLKRGMGAIQKVVPKFTGTPNTVQQVQKVAQPVAQKTEQLIASRPAPTTGLFNKASEKLAGQVRQHPVIATTAVAAPVVSLMSDGGPVTDKKVVQQQVPASPLVSFKERKARDTALNKAIESGNKDMVDKILSTGRALEVSDTVTKKTKGGSNLFDWSKAGTPAADLIDKDTYKNVKKNESSFWDNMQSKDWWFNPVEGGAGGWDNRLFRLGEMMSYMGTPLSKRGDSPAKRWQASHLKNKEIGGKVAKDAQTALAKQLKDATYKWKHKEIADTASEYFDSWFGTDVPMFGKNKDKERARFLRDLTDAKAMAGSTKSLQTLIDELLAKGDYK